MRRMEGSGICGSLVIGDPSSVWEAYGSLMTGHCSLLLRFPRRFLSRGFLGRFLGAAIRARLAYRFAQSLGRGLDQPRVELLGEDAGAVILDELELLGRELRIGGRGERVRVRVRGRAVEWSDELDGERAVVARLLERLHQFAPVVIALPAAHAVVVSDVEVHQLLAGVQNRLVEILFLDIDVEAVETHAAVRPDLLGQR